MDKLNTLRYSAIFLAMYFDDGMTCLTPQKWIIKRRLEAAHEMIRSGGKNVSEVGFDVGFKNLSHFQEFIRRLMVLPRQNRLPGICNEPRI